MKVGCNSNGDVSNRYVPPHIGNGDLAMMVDFRGGISDEAFCNIVPDIYRGGFRYDTHRGDLVKFGRFYDRTEIPGEWEQSLDFDTGVTSGRAVYADGMVVESEVFCHLEHNVIVISKKVSPEFLASYRWNFTIGTYRMTVNDIAPGTFAYNIDTFDQPAGVVKVFCPPDAKLENVGTGRCEITSGTAQFTIMIAYDQPAVDFVNSCGADRDVMLAGSCAAWRKYWDETTINPPDGAIARAATSAQYHLRTISTRWSIPVNISNSYWNGKYFGFDEFFAADGLLSSGHLNLVKKMVNFRFDGLTDARRNGSAYDKNPGDFARYPWQSIEKTNLEGSGGGIWLQHYFHMAHIALESYNCAEMANDEEFYREKAYPVVKYCAEFYRYHSIRLDNNTAIMNKCCDLERLGAARENALMTTNGAIATMRAAAKMAVRLKLDANLVEMWQEISDALTAALPHEKGRYVPFIGCKESSVAQLTGLWPYKNISPDDPQQINALEEFSRRQSECGNMYPLGANICTWYAMWKALALERVGRIDEARAMVLTSAESTGCFSETFEIYEKRKLPYFSTAEGIFLSAVAALWPNPDKVRRSDSKR